MNMSLRALVLASAFAALPAFAQPAAEVTLTRLDCGNGFNDQRRFSDTFAYTDPRVPFTDGVPGFNSDRAETVASLDRLKQIEKNLKATVIIQHDPRDVGKLPAFPAAAR